MREKVDIAKIINGGSLIEELMLKLGDFNVAVAQKLEEKAKQQLFSYAGKSVLMFIEDTTELYNQALEISQSVEHEYFAKELLDFLNNRYTGGVSKLELIMFHISETDKKFYLNIRLIF